MLSRSPARPRKAARRVVPRVIALEYRLLMSADPIASPSGTFSLPIAIIQHASGTSASDAPGTPVGPFSFGPDDVGPAVTGSLVPSQIRRAYGIDQLSYTGAGQTIGIVDAYDATSITTDLAAFDSKYGLPAANLVKVSQVGNPNAIPAYNSGWATEISLDVEWAHAVAPGAKILLVEANSNSTSDLFAAVQYAATPSTVTDSAGFKGGGASVVSMSWGGGETASTAASSPGNPSIDSYFQQSGVTYLAASGDNGSAADFPAVSPYVVGVGGTTLSVDAAGNKLGEAAWSGSGGAVSAYTARPSFQKGFETAANRGVPDVSYDADPNSGVEIDQNGSFFPVGGTSAGAPQWAGLIALANQGRAAAGLPTVGTGLTYGTNSALYALAGGTSYTNPNGDFADITTGSNGSAAADAAGVGYDNVTGLGSPVANKLVPDLVGTTQPVNPPATPTVADAGFEQQSVGSGNYQYDPTGSGWTFASSAGITGNGSGFTNGNPAAPEGSQVAFLQSTGSFSQAVANWAAGTYQITFDAAQRANAGASQEGFQVLVDGAVVSTFTPATAAYQADTTATFTVAAGTHTIAFKGLSSGGDTAFVDAVSVVLPTSPPPPPTTPKVVDAGFEQQSVGSGNYQYDPTGSGWTFASSAGITGNGSGFTNGNPAAPEGSQVAFLQSTGSFSQAVANWAAGTYQITFDAAQRANAGASQEGFQVLLDGAVVSTFTPATAAYQADTTATFTVAAGTHTIAFKGLSSGGDTAFVDAVSVVLPTSPPPPPTTPKVVDAGFEQQSVGSGNYQYDPTGSGWTFASSAGITGNGSGFTNGNPAAPEGSQVAFLQSTGSFSQAVANWAAGTYQITFDAAQRANAGASQEGFQVLVDGAVVSTFTPTTAAYQADTTATFTVAAGTHSIAFKGLSSGGDTAFVDAVSVVLPTSPPPPPTTPKVVDAGFEQQSVGSGNYQYDPTGSGWTFASSAGITGNGSGFTNGNPAAPEGSQVAFLQSTGSFSQQLNNWAAGSYTISFDVAQRANAGTSQENFEVLIDGAVVSTFTPKTTGYSVLTTASFTVAAGSHTIAFVGLTSTDDTALIDAVSVSAAS